MGEPGSLVETRCSMWAFSGVEDILYRLFPAGLEGSLC